MPPGQDTPLCQSWGKEGAQVISWKGAVFLSLPKPLIPGQPFHIGAGACSGLLGWAGEAADPEVSLPTGTQTPKDAPGTVLEAPRPH